jgi:hypothetical protein
MRLAGHDPVKPQRSGDLPGLRAETLSGNASTHAGKARITLAAAPAKTPNLGYGRYGWQWASEPLLWRAPGAHTGSDETCPRRHPAPPAHKSLRPRASRSAC